MTKMKRKYSTTDIKTIVKLPIEECKKKLAQLSKGLAHPARVEIVAMLANRPQDAKCVCSDIVEALPLAQSTVSQHLKVLKETGWIKGQIDRPRVCYCLVDGVFEYYVTLIEHCIEKV
jgi:DNA-binding transcriptional ArsR family regulator